MFSATVRSGNKPGCWCMTEMPAAWTSCGRPEDHWLAVELEMAAGRRINTSQQLHAGALTSTILPEQRQHFAGTQFERCVHEGNCPAKGLCGVNQGNRNSHTLHLGGIDFAVCTSFQHLSPLICN